MCNPKVKHDYLKSSWLGFHILGSHIYTYMYILNCQITAINFLCYTPSCIFIYHVFVFVLVLKFQIPLAFRTPHERESTAFGASSPLAVAVAQINVKVALPNPQRGIFADFCIPTFGETNFPNFL